jgi:hypothetical protein
MAFEAPDCPIDRKVYAVQLPEKRSGKDTIKSNKNVRFGSKADIDRHGIPSLLLLRKPTCLVWGLTEAFALTVHLKETSRKRHRKFLSHRFHGQEMEAFPA